MIEEDRNGSQQEAIQKCVTQSVTACQGPPGTGKTAVEVAVTELLLKIQAATSKETEHIDTVTDRCLVDDKTGKVVDNSKVVLASASNYACEHSLQVLKKRCPWAKIVKIGKKTKG